MKGIVAMKHITSFIVGMMLMVACGDYHTSDNGELDGFWQLMQTDTLSNGHSEDMRQRQIFWSVQADLLRMSDLHALYGEYVPIYFRFELKGDRLRVYDPVADRRIVSDSIVTDVETVRFYGLNSLDEAFRVLQLEDTKMTLENERLRMYFRKY